MANKVTDTHTFLGKWITNDEFSKLAPRNVFARQLDGLKLDCDEHRNRHILFRRKFNIDRSINNAKIFVSADDFYKLYINGKYVAMGPAPSYHTRYNYNEIDVAKFLHKGENVIAVHTLYQGLINRVWQSGDNRHGLILDLLLDDECILSSDTDFKTHPHTAYREIGTIGYDTQFLESYDSGAKEVGFESPGYDDSYWGSALYSQTADHNLVPQRTEMLKLDLIPPKEVQKRGNTIFADFGSNLVGYLTVTAKGSHGMEVKVRMGQELNEDGTVRYKLRANCEYEEIWYLSSGISVLDQFDYKSARYAEITVPMGCEILDIYYTARHYPFELKASLREELRDNEDAKRIWDLCVNTQKYGVQEAVLDCMEREKGFYVGDGCYTALTHMILTGRDDMVRKLIDESFYSTFVTDTLLTCLNGSFMQEIAEYPLMLVKLVLWHYRLTEDKDYLRQNYSKVIDLLDAYRARYENNYLLSKLDKWCVVEWPANFRDGYDVDLSQGKICKDTHIAINAYYIDAIKCANKMARILDYSLYRDEKLLTDAFIDAFYISDKQLFRDGTDTDHVSLVGNVFAFAFELCPNDACRDKIKRMIAERKISSLGIFTPFPLLEGLIRYGYTNMLSDALLDEGAWLRMLKEDATTTFEGWGRDTKWNTSLFHITLSYAAVFLSDIDLNKLFS